jgi:CHAT domain-containing protein
MRRRSLALLVLAGCLLAWPATPGRSQEESELLLPGVARERSIADGDAHVYRVDVTDTASLVIVEQRSLDLVVEAARAGTAFSVDAGEHGWGSEVLLLEGSGDHRIVVRPKERLVSPGRYTISLEALPAPPDDRFNALSLMTRAGQEASGRNPEARRQAMALYREALAVWRSLEERRWEAETLYAIAVLEKDLSDLPAAAGDYQKALALWRELDEPRLEAASLYELAVVRSSMGEAGPARETLQSVLSLWQSLGERFNEGRTRDALCYLDLASGALPSALTCYEEALALFRELGDGREEARILNNLGGVYDGLGEPDSALERYEQALAVRRAIGDRRGEAEVLNNIAVIHRVLGDWQEALRVYGQVREMQESLGDDRSLKGKLLSNLGFAYNSLGEPQRALTFLEDALKLRRETGDRRGEIITLNNLGDSWRKLGDVEKGLDQHRNALEQALALGDRRQEASSRLRIAEALLARSDAAAALRELEPALVVLAEMGIRHSEAQGLLLRGRALAMAGRPREALPVLLDVLARRRALRDRAGEADALHALAAVERSLDLREEARAHAEEAVARVEELRTGFVSPDLRAAFLATQRRAYSLLIDLLMDRHAADPGGGYDQAALAVSERARARSLLDVLFSGNLAHAGSSIPAKLVERRQSLRRRLSAKADQQLKQGGARAEALGREVEALLADLDSVEAEIRRIEPRYAAVSAPPSLGVKDIAGLLDPATLLLEYSLGEERSFLWAVSAGGMRSFVLPPRKEIEELAREIHEELSTVGSGAGRQREATERLGKILLGPIWGEAAQVRRLIVVPDGALHVLPFTALQVPEPGRSWDASGATRHLLDHQEVVYLPSATTLALGRQRLERRPPAPKLAAIVADPVFSPHDARLARTKASSSVEPVRSAGAGTLPSFERLPSSRREAEAIRDLAPAGQVWSKLDLEASRETVLSGELSAYRVIHFATHGVADTRNPELSGLVLSLVDAAGRPREGFLSLTDVYDLNLNADLVVLSGCRTALGKEVSGEGIMGLTRGFLYAGAPRVVASLWPVQDRTTAELMRRFYRALWQDHLPPAAALREAQRSLREDDPRYRDPYSWAGFVLQGDWR